MRRGTGEGRSVGREIIREERSDTRIRDTICFDSGRHGKGALGIWRKVNVLVEVHIRAAYGINLHCIGCSFTKNIRQIYSINI